MLPQAMVISNWRTSYFDTNVIVASLPMVDEHGSHTHRCPDGASVRPGITKPHGYVLEDDIAKEALWEQFLAKMAADPHYCELSDEEEVGKDHGD